MGEAVLRIRAEGGPEVARLLADVERLVAASSRRSARARAEAEGSYRTSARQTADEVQQQDRLVTRNRLRQLALEGEARRKAETQYAIMVNRATAALEREVGKRRELTEKEQRQVHELAQAMMVEHDRAERAKTEATRRETARRTEMERGVRQRVGRAVEAVGRAGMQFASEVHGATQDSRERRAGTEHTYNAAFFQAGVSGTEARAMRQMLDREVATGSLRGLRSEDVAGSLNAAQTQFSVLSGRTAGDRMGNLQRQIELMALARNSYQDPGEVMRVAGMLGQQGIRGADQRATIMSLTGMAQAGAIELSTLTSAAMGPLMQNIARVTNAGQTPAQRSAAVQGAVAETMAVGEIGAAAGLTPRDALNALAKMRSSVENPRMAENLYGRLHSMGRDDLAGQLFNTQNGRHTLRDPNAVNLMSRLVTGMGGNANAVTNLLSPGGPGSPMVLDAQQRRLISAMASQSSNGETIAQRVARMQATGAEFTEADVRRGAAMVNAEQQTSLNSAREQRDNALTDNTSALVRLSNSLHDLQQAHPVAGAGINAATGLAGALGGSLLTRGAGNVVARAAVPVAARLATMGGVGAAGTTGALVLASAGAGLGIGYGINRAMGHNQQSDNPFSSHFYTEFARSVRDAVRDGMSSATVTVSQHDAVHAATVAQAGGGR